MVSQSVGQFRPISTVMSIDDLNRIDKAIVYLRQRDDGSAESYDIITDMICVRAWLSAALERAR